MNSNSRNIISILLIMGPVLTFGALNMPTQMTISLFAGFASAVLLNLDKFDSFTAWKLKAKMREATEKIDDANATIEQLKSVTEPLLKSNLILLLHDGSFDGMGIEDKERTFLELLKIKEVLKLESVEEYINKAAKGVANLHFHELMWCIDNDDFKEKYNKYTTIHFAPETPSVSEIEQFLNDNPDTMTRELKEKFDRFKEFKEKHLEK